MDGMYLFGVKNNQLIAGKREGFLFDVNGNRSIQTK